MDVQLSAPEIYKLYKKYKRKYKQLRGGSQFVIEQQEIVRKQKRGYENYQRLKKSEKSM